MAKVITEAGGTITITGGTANDPITMENIFDEDVVQGWGLVTNPIRFAYNFGAYVHAANLAIGDGSTPTYLQTRCSYISFTDHVTEVKEVAQWKDGYLNDESNNIVKLGSHISFDLGYVDAIKGAGKLLFYGTTISTQTIDGVGCRIYVSNADSKFIRVNLYDIAMLIIEGDATFKDLLFVGQRANSRMQLQSSSITFKNIKLRDLDRGIYTLGNNNVSVEDITTSNCVYDIACFSTWTGEMIIDNSPNLSEPPTINWFGGNAGNIYKRFPFNIHVKDKDGVNLQSVTCLLVDKDDNTIFSISTGADGKTTEQKVSYWHKYWDGSEQTDIKSPHKLTLSKANYETLVIDEITMDELKSLEFELLPALAVSDVRLATNFGEDKTGTLDLASEDDVEYLVKFDNETKTGKFVSPDGSDVATDIGYGTNGEFIGTYARQTVRGIARGQAAEGVVVGE